MHAYDATNFSPPAPIATVDFVDFETRRVVNDVLMLLDTGADVSVVPKAIVDALGSVITVDAAETVSIIGGTSSTGAAQLQMRWLQFKFTGTFLVIDASYGIIGRNILNRLRIAYDGPQQGWDIT